MGIWLRRLSYLAVLGFPLSVLGTKLGFYDFRGGFKGLEWTVYLAIAVVLAGIIVAIWHRRSQPSSARHALIATLLAAIPIIGIGSQLYIARSVPPIHNISTDVLSPPQFDKIVELRANAVNPHEYDIEKLAETQAKAYPEVKTQHSKLSVEDAFDRALDVVNDMGWELVDQNQAAGRIEATETTPMWGFKDDVVIRIQASESGGSKIDLRSVSRVGQSDLGANAKRILRFLEAVED